MKRSHIQQDLTVALFAVGFMVVLLVFFGGRSIGKLLVSAKLT